MTPVFSLSAPALLTQAMLPPVLAQQDPPPNAPEFGGSSPIGLVVIILLFIAMGFLIRSMNKHLRKVPASFEEPDGAGRPDVGRDSKPAENPPDTNG